MKKIIISIPDFDGAFNFNWESDSKIEFKVINSQNGYIKANKQGLISLANHLLNLAQDEVFDNYHFHLDQYNSLENGSDEIIFEKDNTL